VKSWTVIVAENVQRQIDEHVFRIAIHSINNALAWEARVRTAVAGLADVPGYAVDEDASDRVGYEVRKLVFERTYLIHFRRDESTRVIQVLNFRHGAREPRPGEP
jgi:plasmid stabilization system protein ParE